MGLLQTKPRLSDAEIQKLKEATKFSETEIEQWHRIFMRECPDGRITAAKFRALHSDMFPIEDAQEFSERKFRYSPFLFISATVYKRFKKFRDFKCLKLMKNLGIFNFSNIFAVQRSGRQPHSRRMK